MPLLTQDEVNSMRAETHDTQFDMLCTVSRRSSAAEDPGGHPVYTWNVVAADIPCHYWQQIDQELQGTENATITRDRIIMAANYVVTDADRITSVKNFDGIEQLTNPLNIIEVLNRLNDTLLAVQEVT